MLNDLDIASIAAADIPAVLTQLAAWQCQLAARLMSTPAPAPEAVPDEPDRWLTISEACELLRCSKKHVYRHQASWPFARKLSARQWRFSEQGLQKWLSRKKG
jgi:excisionase family DNA binding protein